MSSGGRRDGAGRRLGAYDKTPRRDSKYYKKFMEMAEAFSGEFFITNPATKVFDGNHLDFFVAVMKDERINLKYRLPAAAKVAEYQVVPTISGPPEIDTGEALIAAINKLRFSEEQSRDGEIIPPAPQPASPPPPVKRSVTDVPLEVAAPAPTASPAEPVAEPGPDMMEVHFPTRSGVITKLVPRLTPKPA